MRIRRTRVHGPSVAFVLATVGGATLLLGLAASRLDRPGKVDDPVEVDHATVVESRATGDRVETVPGRPTPAGMQVAVDPTTGLLRPPTPEEARVLAEQVRARLDRSSVGLPVRTRPDGSRSVDLRGRFQTLSVVRANENGELETICVSRAEDVEAALQGRDE
jgi:hypothetical protein